MDTTVKCPRLAGMVTCVLLVLPMACGGSDGGGGTGGPFVAGIDPGVIGVELPTAAGEGSDTLEVEARIEASPADGERAARAGDLETTFEVDVRTIDGQDISGATVTVDSGIGPVSLDEGGCERRYCGRQSGYSRTYVLSVTRGPDFVDSVRLSGPEFHEVTEPAPGAEIDSELPLTIRWAPSDQADRVRVETRELDEEISGDPGEHAVPAGTLRARSDEPADERVRVRRERETQIAGAVGSSTLVVLVRNGVEFFTSATR